MREQKKHDYRTRIGILVLSLVLVVYFGRSKLKQEAFRLGNYLFFIRAAPVFCYTTDGLKVKQVFAHTSPKLLARKPFPEELVVRPGVYEYEGNAYDISHEGIVRWTVPGRRNLQRIVYAGNVSTLIASICWVVSHGNRDDFRSLDNLVEKAKGDKLILTCNRHVEFAQEILRSCGISSRKIAMNASRPRNGYNDGHVMLEVILGDSGRRILVDPAGNCIFNAGGQELNIEEFMAALGAKNLSVTKLADDISIDPASFVEMGYNFNMVMEYIKLRPVEWYVDICGIISVDEWIK